MNRLSATVLLLSTTGCDSFILNIMFEHNSIYIIPPGRNSRIISEMIGRKRSKSISPGGPRSPDGP